MQGTPLKAVVWGLRFKSQRDPSDVEAMARGGEVSIDLHRGGDLTVEHIEVRDLDFALVFQSYLVRIGVWIPIHTSFLKVFSGSFHSSGSV